MANQYTVRTTGRNPHKTVTLRIGALELSRIDKGAAALGESRSATLRHGALNRATAALRNAKILPFRCEFCPRQFAGLNDALAHVETAHPRPA